MRNYIFGNFLRVRYLFPRAHGVVYVRHALVLMWYRLRRPEAFAVIVS